MILRFTKSFQKDFERRIEGTRMESELVVLLELLKAGQPLPSGYRDHALVGNWKGYRDCHLRGDMVVIYRVEGEVITLTRINTHSELFG